ncbi:MAG: type II-A CRISPR-associated protein Csn2 [Clostridiaceae bacterium]|nr:type II-A CRISPR-associated protein Csn2 [Clostridiaceae bacterium]
MKLVHSDVQYVINFEENSINVIVIEDPTVFTQWIVEFLGQASGLDGKFVLSENSKEIKISQAVEVITDPFGMQINSRKVLSKLYTEMESDATDAEMLIKTRTIECTLINYIQELASMRSYPISYLLDVSLPALFKAMELKLDEDCDTLTEKLDTYIKIVHSMLGIRCLMLVNFSTFLCDSDMKRLIESAFYNKVYLLLFENRKPAYTIPGEKIYVLDKDHCEIY